MQTETRVTQVLPRTKDTLSVRFARPADFDYKPGQFMFITAGEGEQKVTKHISLSSSPTEDFLEVTKRLTGHEFSNALAALAAGDMVSIRGPYGAFTFQGEYDTICMLTGGIGITPMRSIIRYSTDKELPTSIVLLYSSRHEGEIIFEDELESMAGQNPNFRVIKTVTRPGPAWRGLSKRIDREMIEREVPNYADCVFFVSGPRKMVDEMIVLLEDLGLPEDSIKREYFTGFG
ncbi:MAG TPA: FAD-binding oxidoreductase [Methanothrix sp.]|nr:FAD-binding oxidoreductase [Methanothrix sp.]